MSCVRFWAGLLCSIPELVGFRGSRIIAKPLEDAWQVAILLGYYLLPGGGGSGGVTL